VGNLVDQLEGSFRANAQRFQVAVVYAKDAGVRCECAIEFGCGVDFDERLHAEFATEGNQVAKLRIVQGCHNQEKTVGVIGAGFPDLPGIENEILAKDWQRDSFSGFAQILERAMKEFFLSKDGKGGGAGSSQRACQRWRVEGIAQ